MEAVKKPQLGGTGKNMKLEFGKIDIAKNLLKGHTCDTCWKRQIMNSSSPWCEFYDSKPAVGTCSVQSTAVHLGPNFSVFQEMVVKYCKKIRRNIK